MNAEFKFNANEFSKMLGISPSALRKRRLSGKMEGLYLKQGKDFFYKSFPMRRPNYDSFTPGSSRLIRGQSSMHHDPSRTKLAPRTNRRRNVAYDETNYGATRGGNKLQLTNDLRQLTRIKGMLKQSELSEITDDLVVAVKEKLKQKKLQRQKDLMVMYSKPYTHRIPIEPKMTGTWFNHYTGRYENYDAPKKKYKYYD